MIQELFRSGSLCDRPDGVPGHCMLRLHQCVTFPVKLGSQGQQVRRCERTIHVMTAVCERESGLPRGFNPLDS